MGLAQKLRGMLNGPPSVGNQPLIDIITGLGLTSGLKLCLDAGDAASYDPAVQTDKWLDTSGNGCDFFRGSGTGSDAADPTFNGTAGNLSANEFFSFDGGDFLRYDSTNEAWMNNLHKNNAVYTIFSVFYIPYSTTSSQVFFGTRGRYQGVSARCVISTDITELGVWQNLGGANLNVTTPNTRNPSGFSTYGLSVDEPTGAGVVNLDGTTTTFTATYTGTTSSTKPAGTCTIGARTEDASNDQILQNGAKIAMTAVWEGTALSSAQLESLRNAVRGRYGI